MQIRLCTPLRDSIPILRLSESVQQLSQKLSSMLQQLLEASLISRREVVTRSARLQQSHDRLAGLLGGLTQPNPFPKTFFIRHGTQKSGASESD